MVDQAATRPERPTGVLERTRRGYGGIALLLVPMLYALGFLALSSYAGQANLGFHALPAPQYLVAGFLFALIIGPMIPLETWLAQSQTRLQPSLSKHHGVLLTVFIFAVRVAVFVIWFIIASAVLALFQVMELSSLEALFVGVVVSLAQIAFLASFRLVVFVGMRQAP